MQRIHEQCSSCSNRLAMIIVIFTLLLQALLMLSGQSFSTSPYSKSKITTMFSKRSQSKLDAVSEDSENYDIKLQSPCKINLFLRILGRRANGFHDLASLFQTISLSDTLYMSKLPMGAAEDILTCSDPSLEVNSDNLVVKALALMRRHCETEQYFKVHLEKNIPIQAGLGGGSGNAATAMHGFNVLNGFPATNENLLEWSGEIGSDISFFFSSGTAYCTGRGEIVNSLSKPFPDADRAEVHIFKPAEGLSTGKVFGSLDLNQCNPTDPEDILQCFQSKGVLDAASQGYLINDLEPPAFANQHKLADLKTALLKTFFKSSSDNNRASGGVMMSGSGTSIFAITDVNNSLLRHEEILEFLERFPSVQHYRCSFVSRNENSLSEWFAE